ncbi:MAG: hypothetical protein L0L76_10430 [Yaniella sp.]|uniref:hypothetical protein n=1 Tax=Yaniella sp. TaxID=2773929 RepID=UPI00264A46F6|nr:hypothetical protein [Yaniella sp.]MDN6759005.1 hypothetical protein [Yaniella sp.]
MSDDKLSQEEMREDIKNLLSWGHAHDYDDIIQEARADAWDEALELLENNSEIDLDDLEHYKEICPYRKQEEA